MSAFPLTADAVVLPLRAPLEVTRSITIPRPPADVFAYVSDFTRTREWRTEVVESTMQPGPMRLGTRVREVALIAGDRVVTESVIDGYDVPRRISFAHVSGPIQASSAYVIEALPGGARFTYTLRVQLHNWWVLAAPVFAQTGHGTIDRSLQTLASILRAGHDRPDRPVAA